MTSQFKFDEKGNVSQVGAVSNEDLRDRQMVTGDLFAHAETIVHSTSGLNTDKTRYDCNGCGEDIWINDSEYVTCSDGEHRFYMSALKS
jgi:hypothetical protein